MRVASTIAEESLLMNSICYIFIQYVEFQSFYNSESATRS
jgi:hypothetical protein